MTRRCRGCGTRQRLVEIGMLVKAHKFLVFGGGVEVPKDLVDMSEHVSKSRQLREEYKTQRDKVERWKRLCVTKSKTVR